MADGRPDNDQLTAEQVLLLINLWAADIDSVPFKHADYWTRIEQAAR